MVYLGITMRSFMTAIVFLTLSGASAQSDSIFPNVDGLWDMTTTTWDWDGQDMNYIYYYYALRYNAQPSQDIGGMSWGTVTDFDFIPVGLIAVDQEKVYFRSTGPFDYGYGSYYDTTAQVLYDFGLSVNDTAYLQNGTYPIIVQSIDTVWLAGHARKRLHLGSGEDWVAGIGSMQGLLVPFQYYFEVMYTMGGFCGDYLTADSIAYQGCLPLSMGIPRVFKDPLAVHPNPSPGIFFITGAAQDRPYRLTDMKGIDVLEGRTTSERTILRVPDAIPGIYVLDVDGVRIKVVVQ